jgi:hypothetical protein
MSHQPYKSFLLSVLCHQRINQLKLPTALENLLTLAAIQASDLMAVNSHYSWLVLNLTKGF